MHCMRIDADTTPTPGATTVPMDPVGPAHASEGLAVEPPAAGAV